MIKRILRSKKGISLCILLLSTLVIGLSYGTFVITTDKYKSSELLISELNYAITIEEDNPKISTINGSTIAIPANSKNYFDITISSVNKIESKYTLAYNKQENIIVEYTDKTSWNTEGVIKGYDENTYSKTIRVIIENTSNETKEVNFKVFGGYSYNSFTSIALIDGYYTISGPYKETLAVSSSRLIDIIETDTKCTTTNTCLYGGESLNNYIQYPENKDKTKNLWRIIGSYNIDNTIVPKLISLNNTTTPKSNIQTSLTNFYNTLDNTTSNIFTTNKFNCNETGCTESSYNNIGLISTYEYETIGGLYSYLKPTNNYFTINNTNINNITQNGIEETSESTTSGLRPSIYLNTNVKVSGSGTLEDPYIIKEESDINLISYTYNGNPTEMSYKTLVDTKYVQSITCKNGSKVEWNETKKAATFTDIQVPDYCTIDFIDKPILNFYATLTSGKTNEGKYEIDTTRTNFSTPFGGETITQGYNSTGKIYLAENNYYFAGNPSDNWVKFANKWWRIIRTNSTEGTRLLYAGTSHNGEDAYINNTTYQWYTSHDDAKYVQWSYASNTIGNALTTWYNNNITEINANMVNDNVVYCNDTRVASTSGGVIEFGAYYRIVNKKTPGYACGTNSNSTHKSIGLMTIDEAAFAGGVYGQNTPNTYFYRNSISSGCTGSNVDPCSVTGDKSWWTMSPADLNVGYATIFVMRYNPSQFHSSHVGASLAVRPVITLKPNVLVTGSGTTDDPYEPVGLQ